MGFVVANGEGAESDAVILLQSPCKNKKWNVVYVLNIYDKEKYNKGKIPNRSCS
jgi:hypothetical protein